MKFLLDVDDGCGTSCVYLFEADSTDMAFAIMELRFKRDTEPDDSSGGEAEAALRRGQTARLYAVEAARILPLERWREELVAAEAARRNEALEASERTEYARLKAKFGAEEAT